MAAHTFPVQEQQLISVDEYLRTIYHPDCDFVDGRVEERNVGEYEHSIVQKMLLRTFWVHEAAWGVEAIQECRMQVTATRYRVPDVMVLHPQQVVHRIVREAPLLCVEVLSPEDTWRRLRVLLGDYLALGVAHIWAFDPEERTAHRFDADGFHLVTEPEMVVAGTPIRLQVADVFSLLPPVDRA